MNEDRATLMGIAAITDLRRSVAEPGVTSIRGGLLELDEHAEDVRETLPLILLGFVAKSGNPVVEGRMDGCIQRIDGVALSTSAEDHLCEWQLIQVKNS